MNLYDYNDSRLKELIKEIRRLNNNFLDFSPKGDYKILCDEFESLNGHYNLYEHVKDIVYEEVVNRFLKENKNV